MASPPQLTQITFAGGIDESVEGEILDPNASFKRLENIRQDRVGGASKRLGFSAMTRARLDASTRSSGRRLFERRGVPVVLDATTIDEFSSSSGTWVNYGLVPEVAFTETPLSSLVASVVTTFDSVTDIAFANGYFAVASHSNTVGYLSVVDRTGVTIRLPEKIFPAVGAFPQLGSYGNYLIAISWSLGSANVPAFYLDTTSAATITTGWVSIGNIATDHSATGGIVDFPNALFSLSDRIAFSYANSSGGTSRLSVKTFNIAGVIQTTTINTSSTNAAAVDLYASTTSSLYVGWVEGTSVKIIGLTPTTLSTITSTTGTIMTLDASGCDAIGLVWIDGSSTGRVLVTESTLDRTQMRNFATTAGATVTSGAQTRVPVARLSGKPFVYNSRVYAIADPFETTGIQNRQFMCVLSDWTANQTWIRPVANTQPFLAQNSAARNAHAVPVTATTIATIIGVGRNVEAFAAEVLTWDFACDTKRSVTSLGGTTYLGDGLQSTFDGAHVTELGFVPRPPTPALSQAGTGLTGTFGYVVTYESVTADGRLVQSSVSNAASITVANKTITAIVRPCAITSRQVIQDGSEQRIVLWRTTATGVAPYYRLTTINNITSAATSTYIDTTADASLQTNAQLMGTGSLPGTGAQLDRRAPTGLQNLTSYNGFLVGSRGTDLFWSSQDIAGEEPWFSPIFTATVPEDVVALVPLDGTLYILCRRSVYATSGDPPTDNGTQGGLGTPRRLSSDAGCIDSGSVVGCGLGIFFQSDRGIEILGRDGSVQWIGQPVQKTTDAYPYITSATLDTQNAVVRFTLATTRTNGVVTAAGGASLVYDLTLSKWVSKDLVTGQVASEAAQDACMVQVAGVWRYAWLGQDGFVYTEKLSTDADGYLDGATWVARTAESADFKIGGLQGKQIFNRALLLERLSTAHDLSVEVAYDYSTTYEAPVVYSAATLAALLANGWPVTQIQVSGSNNSDGQAVRFRITDATPSSGVVGSGKAGTWLGLTVDITPKEGAMKLPDAAT